MSKKVAERIFEIPIKLKLSYIILVRVYEQYFL